MLGAQARAAELQAAKSAAMRQKAQREAEDQKLPPESALVSLTDFARNSLLSKNKGVKAFRPLIDSDFEPSNSQEDSQHAISQAGTTDSTPVEAATAPPIAPRAMLFCPDSKLSKLTPSRARAPAFTPRDRSAYQPAGILDLYDGPVSSSPIRDATQNIFGGYVFGPDDLSPSKQEVEFFNIHQQPSVYAAVQTPVHHFPAPFIPDARIYTPNNKNLSERGSYYLDTFSQHSFHPQMYSRPYLHHHHSEPGTSAGGIQSHLDRTQSFADDLMSHHQRLQYGPPDQESSMAQAVHTIDQPYDRNSKMQSFVAAQQAMARKGKTVLHNPELSRPSQRFTTSDPPLQVSPVAAHSANYNHPPMPILDHENYVRSSYQGVVTHPEGKEAILRAIPRRENREILRTTRETEKQALRQVEDTAFARSSSEEEELKPESEDLVASEWCDLRPITIAERETMLQATRRIARDSFDDSAAPSFFKSTAVVGLAAQNWLREESAKLSARQSAVLDVVDEHEKRMIQLSAYGIIGKPIAKERSTLSARGTLRAVATIMSTLYDSGEGHANIPIENNYTQAPEHAIETNPGNSLSAMSLFDDLGFKI